MARRRPQPTDTNRRRDADAARVRRAAGERFAAFPRLYFYTLPLNLPEGTPLHSEVASSAARAVAESVFGSAPARWKLERGRGGSLHVHAVSPLPPVAVHAFDHVILVYDLRGLLAYLAKPADARRCRLRPSPWSPDSATRARDHRDALDERARLLRDRQRAGKTRLSPVTGWSGVRPCADPAPTLRARVAVALVAAACAYLLAAVRADARRPAPTPYRAPPRPFLAPPAPRARYRRTHEPGAPERPIQGSAR